MPRKWICRAVSLALQITLASYVGLAVPRVLVQSKRVVVDFAKGRSSASLAGNLHGYDFVEYLVKADRGENLTVRLIGNNRFFSVGIYEPGGTAICAETCPNPWIGRLSQSGDYIIRVGLVRNEARR